MSERQSIIIHTEASKGWGGQEIRILTECLWFRDQGFRCMLLTPPGTPLAEAFLKAGLHVMPVAFQKSTQVGDFMKCLKLFRQTRPHMVGTHSNIDTRVALAAAWMANIPNRIRYRHVSIPVKPSPWNHLIYRKFASGIITTARSITAKLTENFSLPAGFAATIPTGVGDTDLSDKCSARSSVRQSLGLSNDARIVCQVSVLRAWKGHADLMAAFDQLAATDARLHLVLVGGGPGLCYLPEQAAALKSRDRIHFVGHQLDPYPYFKAADVVVLASTGGEGVPQSALQCFACASPFVGTHVGGIPDIVANGENGMLVAPECPADLAKAISCLLEDPNLAAKIGANARATYERIGSIEQMGMATRDFLHLR